MKARIYILLSLFLCIVFIHSLAHAVAISDNSALLIFNWDSALFEWNISNYALNGADADLDGVADHPTYIGGWVANPAFSLTAQVTPDSTGVAETTNTSASATAYSRADGIGTTSPPEENVYTTATSHRGKTFSPYTSGNYTITAEYIISQNFSQDFLTEGTSGWSTAQLLLSQGGTQVGYDEIIANNLGTTVNGLLSITLSLDSSKWYYLEGHVYTDAYARSPEQTTPAPVPEPDTLLLLGAGMVGLARTARRKLIK